MHRRNPKPQDDLFQVLAHEPMHARLEANPAEGPFPLIIYGTGGGSDPWGNTVLFEYLAGHGYVVATSPSFGTYSFDVEWDARGIETKARDMEFFLAQLMNQPYIDADSIDVDGWGGLDRICLAMRNSGIDAVVCLDGSSNAGGIYGQSAPEGFGAR